jgi:hypothetical protein
MRHIIISGIAIALLLIAIAVVVSASTTNNIAGGINANNYSMSNLKHLTVTDLTAYMSVYHTSPYYAQVQALRSAGMSNDSIEKIFSDNGIYYNSTGNVFVIRGRPGTQEELAKSIAPTYPFNVISTSQSDARKSLRISPTTSSTEDDVVMSVFSNVYQGVKENMRAGSLAVSSNVIQHVAPIHIGANGVWIEVGVVNRPGAGNRPYIYDPTQAGQPCGGWYYFDGEWDVSPNTYNNYKISITYSSGTYFTDVAVNNEVYYEIISPTGNLNNNVDSSNEAWANNNVWDAHDSVHTIAQNMYIDSSGTWNGWQVAGAYIHWSPALGCAFSNSFSTYQGTAKMETWLR